MGFNPISQSHRAWSDPHLIDPGLIDPRVSRNVSGAFTLGPGAKGPAFRVVGIFMVVVRVIWWMQEYSCLCIRVGLWAQRPSIQGCRNILNHGCGYLVVVGIFMVVH